MAQPNPFEDVEKLLERLDRQFENGGVTGRREVAVDVAERDGEFVVVADLPGYDRDDIDVSLADRTLTISTERTEERDASDADSSGRNGPERPSLAPSRFPNPSSNATRRRRTNAASSPSRFRR